MEEVCRWRAQGEKLALIAVTFGLTEPTVSKMLKRHNVVPLLEPEHRMSVGARR